MKQEPIYVGIDVSKSRPEAGERHCRRQQRVDSGRGQDRTLRGVAPVECAIDGWS